MGGGGGGGGSYPTWIDNRSGSVNGLSIGIKKRSALCECVCAAYAYVFVCVRSRVCACMYVCGDRNATWVTEYDTIYSASPKKSLHFEKVSQLNVSKYFQEIFIPKDSR